jgi:hypothetical protein
VKDLAAMSKPSVLLARNLADLAHAGRNSRRSSRALAREHTLRTLNTIEKYALAVSAGVEIRVRAIR